MALQGLAQISMAKEKPSEAMIRKSKEKSRNAMEKRFMAGNGRGIAKYSDVFNKE
jgi:hypothetical protein